MAGSGEDGRAGVAWQPARREAVLGPTAPYGLIRGFRRGRRGDEAPARGGQEAQRRPCPQMLSELTTDPVECLPAAGGTLGGAAHPAWQVLRPREAEPWHGRHGEPAQPSTPEHRLG